MSSITNEIDELDRLLDDERAKNRRLTTEVEKLKSDLDRERQFICRKCGLREELGIKIEPTF